MVVILKRTSSGFMIGALMAGFLSVVFVMIALLTSQLVASSNNTWSGDLNSRLAFYPGDLLLGGLFPIHTEYNESTGLCSNVNELDGILPLQAVIYLLDEINRQKILPFKLGLAALDTCDSHSFTLEQALHFIHSRVVSNSVTPVNATTTCSKGSEQRKKPMIDAFDVGKVVGLIAGLPSGVTISLATLMRLFHMPQISFLSTSPLLSDKRRYDYFFRTVPSDVNQVKTIVEILKFYQWSHVSIVYSDDEYGNRGLHELEQLAPNASLCVAEKLKLPTEADTAQLVMFEGSMHYTLMVQKLLAAKTDVVILFADYKLLEWFFEAARQSGHRKFVWIGSDGLLQGYEAINDYPEITEGAITVQLNIRQHSQFAHHYINLNPSETSVCQHNPFYCNLWHQCQPDKRRSTRASTKRTSVRSTTNAHCMLRDTGSADTVAFLNIDNLRTAVYAYVYALKNLHQVKCGMMDGLCDAMKTVKGSEMKLFLANVSFTEPDGSTFRFIGGSDGQPRYTILNMHRKPAPNNWTDPRFEWVNIGKYTLEDDVKATLSLNTSIAKFKEASPAFPVLTNCQPRCRPASNEVHFGKGISCCWSCIQCEPWQFPLDNHCTDCPNGFVVNYSALNQSPDQGSLSYNLCVALDAHPMDYRSVYAIPVLAFSAIGTAVSLICGWIMFFHHNTPIVKAAGREHLFLLLCGVISSYVMNFVILWQPSHWSCIMVRFLGVCYAVCNSALLIKISRIYRIFYSADRRKTHKLKYISPKSQIALTIAFIFVELVIIVVWICFDAPKVLELYPSRMHKEVVCSDLNDLKLLSGVCYPLMLLFPMAYFAFRTRTCPASFAEARYTGYGIYLEFINLLTFVLIYIGNNSVPIRVLTVCLGLCLTATVILITTFCTKVYVIVFRPHKNSKERIMFGSKSTSKQTNSGTYSSYRKQSCSTCKAVIDTNGLPLLSRPHSNPEIATLKDFKDMTDSSPHMHGSVPRSRLNTMEPEARSL